MKKKHGRGLQAGGGGGGGLLDRLLVPRIEQYALNNDYTDVEEVTDYMRKAYKEYARRPTGPFRTMVSRAIAVVQRKGVQKPELPLQPGRAGGKPERRGGGAEGAVSSSSGSSSGGSDRRGGSISDDEAGGTSSEAPGGSAGGGSAPGGGAAAAAAAAAVPPSASDASLQRQRQPTPGAAAGSGSSPGSSGSGSESGSQSDSDSDSADSSGRQRRPSGSGAANPSHMNRSLLSMYARTATPGAAAAGGGAAAAPPAAEAEPPAFAPPEVVAAAAARALAREKAEREAAKGGRSGSAPGSKRKAGTPAAADAEGPSTSGRSPGAAPRAAIMLTAAGPQPLPPSVAQPATSTDPGAAAAAPAAEAAAAAATSTGAKRPREDAPEAAAATAAAGKTADGPAAEASLPKSAAKRARRMTGAGGGGGGGLARMGGGGGGNSAVVAARPVRYADLGGVEEVLADIRELIEYPLRHPEVYAWLGVEPPRGVLLHGPPGCGKTALANAIATECGVPFLRVSAPEIVSGMSGESEAKLRGLFTEARELAPCIVFIDEIDAIFPKRETAQREMERRIVAQMLTCMDDLSTTTADQPPTAAPASGELDPAEPNRPPPPHVVVIGATNRPDALDPALRRAGRFDREISLGIPTEAARAKILQVISRRLRLDGNFDFKAVAKRTPGFVGADLSALTKEAAAVAVSRIFSQLDEARAAADASTSAAAAAANAAVAAAAAGTAGLEAVAAGAGGGALVLAAAAGGAAEGLEAVVAAPPRFGGGPLGPLELAGLAITMSDFEIALPKVQPSVRREGFTTTPDVSWDDVGALSEVREELSFAISEPIRQPERFEALGLPAATGVLLYGPPGCGKTLVAKAVANESGANFISIKGPELLNKYVGESERAVRQLFARARAAHPCVLFFDELDALAPRRGTDNNAAAERVVNQLLTEMDGVDSRQGLFIVAATNRPDMIDPALLRPGRLDKVLYVPLPPAADRAAILTACSRRTPLGPDVDLARVAVDPRCEGYSGADCAALVREAAVIALKQSLAAGPGSPEPRVTAAHFQLALARVQPSVSRRDQRAYDAIRSRLRSTRAHITTDPADAATAAAEAAATAAAETVAAAGLAAAAALAADVDGDAVLEDATATAEVAAAGGGADGAIAPAASGGAAEAAMEEETGEGEGEEVMQGASAGAGPAEGTGEVALTGPGAGSSTGPAEGDVMET